MENLELVARRFGNQFNPCEFQRSRLRTDRFYGPFDCFRGGFGLLASCLDKIAFVDRHSCHSRHVSDLSDFKSVRLGMFAARHPSTAWEALPIARCPELAVWAWFRPVAMPSSVTFLVPVEVSSASPGVLPFSLSDLLLMAGIDPSQFSAVSLYGAPWQQAQAYFPYMNQAIPCPAMGGSAEIMLSVFEAVYPTFPAVQPAMVSQPMVDSHPINHGVGGQITEQAHQGDFADVAEMEIDPADDFDANNGGRSLYDRIEASWKAAVQMERQMTGLRQKLCRLGATLGKMDRDLSPEERLAADREDKDGWEDARRWVRDLAGKCHREVKAFDIGITSSAGKRNWMEEAYQTVIEPRAASADLEMYRREFETYRKDIMNLQRAMNTAIQAATQNGTARSQRITGTIQKKIQERRRRLREPIGGTNMDRSCRRRK